ncbi:hypothetical protein [Aureliella helgolandensis]|uniref:Uncharacterized protein n=1 Tax=Aureliella helgolandensis TaxID=2527968 RepID=A0A518GAR2_9BACT|nr:hypothetical protein [Aureliella helgolandensis]QDV25691.1 hypothetical protein Q31a_40180 [Aureliella helgolandensis]
MSIDVRLFFYAIWQLIIDCKADCFMSTQGQCRRAGWGVALLSLLAELDESRACGRGRSGCIQDPLSGGNHFSLLTGLLI